MHYTKTTSSYFTKKIAAFFVASLMKKHTVLAKVFGSKLLAVWYLLKGLLLYPTSKTAEALMKIELPAGVEAEMKIDE